MFELVILAVELFFGYQMLKIVAGSVYGVELGDMFMLAGYYLQLLIMNFKTAISGTMNYICYGQYTSNYEYDDNTDDTDNDENEDLQTVADRLRSLEAKVDYMNNDVEYSFGQLENRYIGLVKKYTDKYKKLKTGLTDSTNSMSTNVRFLMLESELRSNQQVVKELNELLTVKEDLIRELQHIIQTQTSQIKVFDSYTTNLTWNPTIGHRTRIEKLADKMTKRPNIKHRVFYTLDLATY